MELARYSMVKYVEDLKKSKTDISDSEFLKMLKDAVREVFSKFLYFIFYI